MVSSLGSIISVAATVLFLVIVYDQLVYGKEAARNSWANPEFYTDILQNILQRAYTSLEFALSSPPKPHAFTTLPIQSGLSLSSMLQYLKNKKVAVISSLIVLVSLKVVFHYFSYKLFPYYNLSIRCVSSAICPILAYIVLCNFRVILLA